MIQKCEQRISPVASRQRCHPGLSPNMCTGIYQKRSLEARERLNKYYEARDEIEADPRLSNEGKAQEKRKAALKALGAFNGSKSLARAQQSVSDLMDKWHAKVAAAVKPAATEAEAALHAEIRRHVVGLKGQDRMAFLERMVPTHAWLPACSKHRHFLPA